MDMFCIQCEQTAKGTGCTQYGRVRQGPAGRGAAGSAGVRRQGHRPVCPPGVPVGARDRDVDVFTVKALFSTLTNVNFDPQRFKGYMDEAVAMKERAQRLYETAAKKAGQDPGEARMPRRLVGGHETISLTLIAKGREVGIEKRMEKLGSDDRRRAGTDRRTASRAPRRTPIMPRSWARRTSSSTPRSTRCSTT